MYSHKIKNNSFWQGTSEIEITARITVEKGTVQVWLEDLHKNKTLVRVEPGQTVELKGLAWVMTSMDERSFHVHFEPLGETKRAENVQVELRYNTLRPRSQLPRNLTAPVSSAVGSSVRVEHVKMGLRSFITGISKYDTPANQTSCGFLRVIAFQWATGAAL